MKIIASVFFLSLVIPQVTFAFCFWPPKDLHLSTTKGCPPDSTVQTGDLQSGAGATGGATSNAETPTTITYNKQGVGGLFDLVLALLSRAVVLLISIAVVWFIYNVFHYVIAVDEVDKAQAKEKIVWGLIAIFIMVSVWGLVAILQYTFQIFPSSSNPEVGKIMPEFNFPQ